MADLQAELQAVAEEMVATPAETGLQVAVHRYGRVIADVTAGVADPRSGAQVTPGTLFYAASTGKGVTASLAHVLAERGGLRYDMRLADVWPEYAKETEAASDHHLHLRGAGRGDGKADGLWRLSLETIDGWTLRAATGAEADKGPFARLLGTP
jgi:CubicO group peptidase (beta-lactamase class C family)